MCHKISGGTWINTDKYIFLFTFMICEVPLEYPVLKKKSLNLPQATREAVIMDWDYDQFNVNAREIKFVDKIYKLNYMSTIGIKTFINE